MQANKSSTGYQGNRVSNKPNGLHCAIDDQRVLSRLSSPLSTLRGGIPLLGRAPDTVCNGRWARDPPFLAVGLLFRALVEARVGDLMGGWGVLRNDDEAVFVSVRLGAMAAVPMLAVRRRSEASAVSLCRAGRRAPS